MSKLIICIALSLLATSIVNASEPTLSTAGSGTRVSLPEGGETAFRHCWGESPDLEGMGVSSNIISELDMESHVVNDFILDWAPTISHVRWWGVYWHYTPGDPHVTSFNLRFYEDDGCVPGDVIYEMIIPHNANETHVHDYNNTPRYEYEACMLYTFPPGLYWFEVQAGDSPFPPQWGRLASRDVTALGSLFKSEYYSYPEWTPIEIIIDMPYDASQEFMCPWIVEDTCEMTEYYNCYLLGESRGVIEGSNEGAMDDYNPTNGCTGNDASGADIVYYLDLEEGDFMEMTYTLHEGDGSLYLLTDCADMGSCVIGADEAGFGEEEILRYTAAVADRYYLVLDGRGRSGWSSWALGYLVAPATSGVASTPNEAADELTVRARLDSSFDIDFGAVLQESGEIGIFDVSGRAVQSQEVIGGASGIVWNGRDRSGGLVAPGVYFVRLRTGDVGVSTRLVVVK